MGCPGQWPNSGVVRQPHVPGPDVVPDALPRANIWATDLELYRTRSTLAERGDSGNAFLGNRKRVRSPCDRTRSLVLFGETGQATSGNSGVSGADAT